MSPHLSNRLLRFTMGERRRRKVHFYDHCIEKLHCTFNSFMTLEEGRGLRMFTFFSLIVLVIANCYRFFQISNTGCSRSTLEAIFSNTKAKLCNHCPINGCQIPSFLKP